MPLTIGHQVNFVLLIAALQAWQSSQFPTHLIVQLATLHLTKPIIRILQEPVLKALLNSREVIVTAPPLINGTSHLLSEGSQAGQVEFALCKSVLTAQNHILVLRVAGREFQKHLFYDFPVTERLISFWFPGSSFLDLENRHYAISGVWGPPQLTTSLQELRSVALQ